MPKVDAPTDRLSGKQKLELAGTRPYTFLGMDLEEPREGSEQAVGDCPFCGREGKFGLNVKSGLWRCLVCAAGSDKGGGNLLTFIRLLWEQSDKATKDYTELQADRKLMHAETLMYFGVCQSTLTKEWLIPGRSVDGKVSNLYRYAQDYKTGRMLLLSTPTLHHGLFGVEMYNKSKEYVYLCEGPWDMMALWETLRSSKVVDDDAEGLKLCVTGSESASMLSDVSVLAVPGCGSFAEKWLPLFEKKRVTLMYDNDHPRDNGGRQVDGAGLAGMKRVSALLSKAEQPPVEIAFLNWGPGGIDTGIKSGFDVRDLLVSGGLEVGDRVRAYEELERKVQPIPEEWVPGRTKAAARNGSTDAEMKYCDNWRDLQNAWKKGLKWTEGLDRALAVMLASITSTESVGDQLWVKIIGPASCISGDTFIGYVIRDKNGKLINKKGGPLRRLYERFNDFPQSTEGAGWVNRDEVDFYVQSMKDDGWIFRNKIEDVVCNGVKPVKKITVESGKTFKATDDHEVMTDNGYKRVHMLNVGDLVMVNGGVTGKKGGVRSNPYRKEVFVKKHKNAKEKVVNGCLYRRLRVYQAVYEAHKNKMAYQDYIKVLNKGTDEEVQALWAIPTGYDVHHKDENINNNDIKNLQVIRNGEHQRQHHGKSSSKHVAIYAHAEMIVDIEEYGETEVFDIVVADPYRNFVAGGVVVHNCGKSTLCEAVSINKKYVIAKSTIRGFHSGFDSTGKGEEDNSLLAQVKNKTLVTKDGDTLLQAPNLGQILSEARDVYDRVSRTHYRNKTSRDYEGVSMTWLLCGTSSLRAIDSSELGERFLDCVIVEDIDEDMEDEVGWRVANRADREMSYVSDGKMETRDGPDMVLCKQLTGGYINYLRENSCALLGKVAFPDEMKRKCTHLAKFVAFMRARPSLKQEEKAEREMSFRLISQHVRLAKCLAVVLNRAEVDAEVMRIVTRTAMDTARGRTFEIARHLYTLAPLGADGDGMEFKALAIMTGEAEEKLRVLTRFLKKIGALDVFRKKLRGGVKSQPLYRLTDRMRKLYEEVVHSA